VRFRKQQKKDCYKMNTKDYVYSWHLSLRVDRPVESCPMRPHAYMYGKKLDERDMDKATSGLQDRQLQQQQSQQQLSQQQSNSLHSKAMKEPPPQHEFSYRWFRGPLHEPCAFENCPRRTSFSPHDWSKHALGGTDCALQCVSTQSSLYKCTFCNSSCFVHAWKTQQYTVGPRDNNNNNSNNYYGGAAGMGGGAGNAGGGGGTGSMPNSRSATPNRSRSASFGSTDDIGMDNIGAGGVAFDETGSTGSGGAASSNGSKSPGPMLYENTNTNTSNNNPSTPRGYLGGYNNNNSNNAASSSKQHHYRHSSNGIGAYTTMSDYNAGEDWIEVSRDQIYMPGPDDIGRRLKLEAAAYSIETGELLMSRVVKSDIVLARPPDPKKRNLVTAKKAAGGDGAAGGGASGSGPRFRVVTYNVLAEIYATAQQYPYCDFWALSWDFRFQNILREIVDASPEVICLQEIQADHYENHVYGAMSEHGFEGVYKQKTRQSMGLAGKVDGCALFWRRSKFHLVESYSIEFNEVAQRQATQVLGLNPRSEEGSAFLNRLSKDNVAQLVVLEFIQPPTRGSREINQVCIANTHLYSNKDFPDVKLWQTWQLLQELESFVMSRGTNLPLIICGDFNSTPDTAVYDLLSRQSVHPGHPDVNVATNDDVPNVLPDAMNISQSFQLGSAYQTVLGDEPWVTNYTENFKGVLDYIWYSVQNLRPLSAAPIPDEPELTRHGDALPSTEYSSDHVMLIADMQIISNGSR
jgi:CCR4-NOT transcription complex subunit 6